jgi:hypothetical protein
MGSHFTDCRQRIDRAAKHAKAFTDEWNGLLKPKAFEYRTKKKGNGAFVFIGRFRVLPKNDLALELGEFFYQLRAALDGAVFKMAEIISAPNPPTDEEALYFPICRKESGFKNSGLYKGPFPQTVKDWFKSVQPCYAHSSSDPKIIEISRRLEVLNECARKDRHPKTAFHRSHTGIDQMGVRSALPSRIGKGVEWR